MEKGAEEEERAPQGPQRNPSASSSEVEGREGPLGREGRERATSGRRRGTGEEEGKGAEEDEREKQEAGNGVTGRAGGNYWMLWRIWCHYRIVVIVRFIQDSNGKLNFCLYVECELFNF